MDLFCKGFSAMRKILFMVTKSENGGAQKWTKEQIEICAEDLQCFLATDENGWLSKSVSVQDKFLDKLIYKRFSISYLMKLSQFIKQNNINLVVASSANAGIYSRLIKLLNRDIKVIYVSHGWSSIYNGGRLAFLYTFIEKQLSKVSDSILCISKKDFENAKGIIGINDAKLKWITNKIYPIKNNQIIKNQDKTIKVLTVARLEPPKRVDLLIEATKDLNDVELHVIGDGSQRNYLESIKHKNVFFHGEIDGFNDFSSYDIFALISDSEGLPLSALEAMSAGLPVILSDVGGCFELINNNGVLVKNNIESIIKAINTCMLNIDEFGNNSKNLFNKKFNLGLSKKKYLDYYQEVLKSL
jgi:glycosyltransferase involved in cell wall biosynthesis